LERGKLVTVAVVWNARVGVGPLLMQKRQQMQMACRDVYWSKQKGYASRRTLNKENGSRANT
jgi:hypothetical protein